MKKIRKNDLKLEKEVISRLSQDDLTGVKGGIYKPQTQLNVDCFQPISYDGNCKTVTGGATCVISCRGGCTAQSVNVACYYTEQCAESHSCQGVESDCMCVRP